MVDLRQHYVPSPCARIKFELSIYSARIAEDDHASISKSKPQVQTTVQHHNARSIGSASSFHEIAETVFRSNAEFQVANIGVSRWSHTLVLRDILGEL